MQHHAIKVERNVILSNGYHVFYYSFEWRGGRYQKFHYGLLFLPFIRILLGLRNHQDDNCSAGDRKLHQYVFVLHIRINFCALSLSVQIPLRHQ